MAVSASMVKELRERTGAGMMECKNALVEVQGDLDAAKELLRKRGQASAAKKASRIAAEGRIELAVGDGVAVAVEVNCESDFVGKDENFRRFARQVAKLALERRPDDLDALMALELSDGMTLEDARRDLVAKIGENISVRRFQIVRAKGQIGSYLHHGDKIGVLVDIENGDDTLRKDVAMHIAFSNPNYISADEVPAAAIEQERKFLSEQAEQSGKPPEIAEKMVEGRLRKYLKEITLLGQPFVKDGDITVGKLLEQSDARVSGVVRLEAGEGIDKKVEDFAAEVQAQIEAQN
jgi:elongation factor Ts